MYIKPTLRLRSHDANQRSSGKVVELQFFILMTTSINNTIDDA